MRALTTLFLLALVLCASPVVQAHARPTTISPEPDARLDTPPTQVWIDFSEPINAQGTRLDVYNATGARMLTTPARVEGRYRAVADVQLNTTDMGYVVRWSTYSVLDGHRMAGSWGFAVGNATPPQAGTSIISPLDFPSVVTRTLAYVGLVGLFALAWSAALFGGATHVVWRYGLVGASLIVASEALRALDQLSREGPLTFFDNPYSQRVLLQLLIGLGMVTVVLLRRNARGVQTLVILVAFWAMANGSGSHARAALGDWGALLDGVHVLLATAWIGALTLLWLDSDSPLDLHRRRAHALGRIALVCLGGLVLTGIGLAASQTWLAGRSPLDLPLNYGLVLLYKLGLVATMVGFGAVNQFAHLPRLQEPPRRALLHANLRREILNGLLVLLMAAILATLDPEFP